MGKTFKFTQDDYFSKNNRKNNKFIQRRKKKLRKILNRDITNLPSNDLDQQNSNSGHI
jgi:hypothetical protein